MLPIFRKSKVSWIRYKSIEKSGHEANEKRLTTGVVWKSAVIYAEREMDCETARIRSV